MRILKESLLCLIMTVIFLLLITGNICAGTIEETGQNQNKPVDKDQENVAAAFLVIIDGLQAEALNKYMAPNIKGLGSAGIKTSKVITVYPEDSGSSIASILTGAAPSKHQCLGDGKNLSIPTVLKLMEDKGIKTAIYDGTEKMAAVKKGVSHVCKGPFNGKDSLVVQNAVNELKESSAYFNVLILSQLRDVLDKHGAESVEYRKQLTETDNQVGRLLHYLHKNGLYEESIIIVTGTCGSPPLVMKGPRLKVGTQLPPVSLTDIAPTIAYLTGLKMNQAEGLVLYNAVKSRSDRSDSYLLTLRVEDLSKAYAEALRGMHRLEKEKLEVKQLQEKVTREKQVIEQKIKARDEKISELTVKINLMKITGVLMVLLFGVGYIIEYKILRKKFLMF
ncbi:MAG: alkaline phosphatase family protein [Desulfotomaculum sp.]|nr:alkaline phosphatase family protein [Desulfotomaculum sp.]